MATRATGLSQDHVQALNLIDLEFQGVKFQNVRKSWKIYLDHLGNFPREKEDQARLPIWQEKSTDFLAELLLEMGKSLGYDFDLVHIKKGIYLPEGHTKLETEMSLLRSGLIHLLYGDICLKMDIQHIPINEDALKKQQDLYDQWLKLLNGKVVIPVSVRADNITSHEDQQDNVN